MDLYSVFDKLWVIIGLKAHSCLLFTKQQILMFSETGMFH